MEDIWESKRVEKNENHSQHSHIHHLCADVFFLSGLLNAQVFIFLYLVAIHCSFVWFLFCT